MWFISEIIVFARKKKKKKREREIYFEKKRSWMRTRRWRRNGNKRLNSIHVNWDWFGNLSNYIYNINNNKSYYYY